MSGDPRSFRRQTANNRRNLDIPNSTVTVSGHEVEVPSSRSDNRLPYVWLQREWTGSLTRLSDRTLAAAIAALLSPGRSGVAIRFAPPPASARTR